MHKRALYRSYLIAIMSALTLVLSGCLLGPEEDQQSDEGSVESSEAEANGEQTRRPSASGAHGAAGYPIPNYGESDDSESNSDGETPDNLPDGSFEQENSPENDGCEGNCSDDNDDGIGHGSPQPLDPQSDPSDDETPEEEDDSESDDD